MRSSWNHLGKAETTVQVYAENTYHHNPVPSQTASSSQVFVEWEKTIFSLLTMWLCTMFGMPAFKVSRIGHSFWVQGFSLSWLSHMQRWQEYFVKPEKKLIVLRFTQRIQLCSWYLSKLMISFYVIICFSQIHRVTNENSTIKVAIV